MWDDRLQALLQDFFTSDEPEDSAMLLQLQSSLSAWVDACQAADLSDAIPLSVISEHWLSQLDQTSLAQRFMAGKLTFATLMPMRAIPFRMVCLLGMNDGEFPRSRPPVDFDLMARDNRPGDRSRRDDDRYLFLEALLSAREKLHISWVGRSIQDNSDRPPSVLVSQLRDHLEACWQLSDDAQENKLLPALTVEHKLQAFSREYFGKDPLISPLFTYAKEWERNDHRMGQEVAMAPTEILLPAPLFETPISLGQLIAFLKDPVKTFYRERLGVYYESDDLTSEDQEPFALDGLGQWSLQDQLIRTRLDAVLNDPENEEDAVRLQLDRIRRRGELPLGKMADLLEMALIEPLDKMFEDYEAVKANWPAPLEDLQFVHEHQVGEHMVTVQGRITQRYAADNARCRIELNSSNLLEKNKYRRDKLIAAWVLHLASHLDGQPMTTQVISKNGQVPINPLDTKRAEQHFNTLIEAYVEGLRAPLPLAPKTGFAWLEKRGVPFVGALANCEQEAVCAARGKYEDSYKYKGEANQSAYLQRIFPTFETLWSNGRFTQLCHDLYAPLVGCVGKSKENN